MASALSLDTICNSAFFFAGQWNPALKRNQSRDLLRHLINRLHGASKGNLFHARIRASHASLAHELDLSREWVCKLSGRLRTAKWIAYQPVRRPDGTHEIGFFTPGKMLKRVLCMLLGYRKPKHRVNEFSHSSPLLQKEREKIFSSQRQKVLDREQQPPSPATLRKIPLLTRWMNRE
jgi:hypothetical protein